MLENQSKFDKSIDRLIGAAWKGDHEAIDKELDRPDGALASIRDATKDGPTDNEVDRLKLALREAMFSTRKVTRRCIDYDPAGSTYEIDWSPEMRRWASLCGVDLGGFDPSCYAT